MMIDFQELPRDAVLKADICVIGSGAAGITIGQEFLGTAYKVIIVESGGLKPERDTQELYRSEITGLTHRGTHGGRARIFGGTTTLWGGQALPLYPIDFEERPWVPHSGWPFSRVELESYYRRAGQVLHLDNHQYEDTCWKCFGVQAPPFDKGKLATSFSQWSPEPNFASGYRGQLAGSGNVGVILHTNVVKIVPNREATTIERVDIRSLAGGLGAVQARYYVICCGGIETARLLLASNDVEPCGLGNRDDLVGRYLQEHIAVRCGEIFPTSRRALQQLFDQFYIRRTKYLPKLACSEVFQRQNQILNVLGNIVFDTAAHPGIQAAKKMFNAITKGKPLEKPSQAIWDIAKDGKELFGMAYRFYVRRRSFSPSSGPIYLEAHCEQEPNPESRVSLSGEKDALGMPRAKIDWRLTDLSWKTVSVFAKMVAAEFERLGLGRITVADGLLKQQSGWQQGMTDLSHDMGTARMHENPRRGVVDSQCRIHGIENLYVGSSAAFPTGGCSNPTLTLIALCLRLADHLKSRLR